MASTRAWVATAVLLTCIFTVPTDGWSRRRRCPSHTSALPGAINRWDQAFRFVCPSGQAISRVQSVHCNHAEDRVWRFECKSVPGLSSFTQRYWSSWINAFDGPMTYACPYNSIVTGFHSEHSNNSEDRRWKVMCSGKEGMGISNRYIDEYANIRDGRMNYYVPYGFYIRGMHGHHDNGSEDRLYRFDLCRINL
ncbi:dermatopontin-like [Branchiostoma floridae]|uniref:Dermatopontin-like n=1 Tax=Branchiostoma floridae TaxID=7739 RepID=A0A9J7LLA2_BRAFL|nr:dermatopontin-like [Branchiostoma floridae]